MDLKERVYYVIEEPLMEKRGLKLLCSVGFLAFSAVILTRYPTFQHESPYLVRRLGVLEYHLNAPLEFERRRTAPMWVVDTPSPIGNALHTWASFPLSGSLLATFSLVTGLSVLETAQLPLVPLAAFVFGATITYQLTDDDILPAICGVLFVFQFTAKNLHFQQYRWGQYAVLPFFVLVLLLYVSRVSPHHKTRWTLLLLLGIITLKLSSPKEEPIVVSALFVLVAIQQISSKYTEREYIERPVGIIAVFSGVLFFVYNPKFFLGILTRLVPGGTTIKVFDGSGDFQLLTNIAATVARVLPGVGSPTQPVPFEASVPASPSIVAYLGLFIYGISGLAAAVFTVHAIYYRRWERLTTPPIVVMFAVGAGGITNFILRAGLIGRPDTSIIYVVFVFAGIVAFARLLSRRHVRIVMTGLLVISVVSVGVTVNYEYNSRPFDRAESGALAEWTADNADERAPLLTDYHSYAEISHEYAALPVENYRTRFPIIGHSPTWYANAINGSLNDSVEYYVANKQTRDYPIHSYSWTYLEPLGEHYAAIRTNTGHNKIYASNRYDVYASDEDSPSR